jgi:hypothetical protein
MSGGAAKPGDCLAQGPHALHLAEAHRIDRSGNRLPQRIEWLPDLGQLEECGVTAERSAVGGETAKQLCTVSGLTPTMAPSEDRQIDDVYVDPYARH